MRLLLVVSFLLMGLFGKEIDLKIDLNTADAKEIAQLRGIGKKRATDIVEYRDRVGCIKNTDELATIKGIGKKTIEKNRENIILSSCSIKTME
jgi:competence protein ComEA